MLADTKFFNLNLKEQLLACIDNFDEQCNGLLLNGDNFQALGLLNEKYRSRVKCIHIDPPYNTDTSGFLYKNSYRHSSWLTMMENRLFMSFGLLRDDGSFICHIDENEHTHLNNLLSTSGLKDLGTVIWDKRNPMTGGKGIAIQHEYIIWMSPSDITISANTENAKIILDYVESLKKQNLTVTEKVKCEYTNWIRSNPYLTGGDKAYSNIDEQWRVYQSVSLRAPEYRTNPKFHLPLIHPVTGKPCPVPPNGFSRTPETLAQMIEDDIIIFGQDETTQPRYKIFLSCNTKKQLTSIVQDAVKGTSELNKMGIKFPYCHGVPFYNTIIGPAINKDSLVIDYFAGSATTAHAVLILNREDCGNRKYILVEMGEYFGTITKPRIEKVVFSTDWKDGKPQVSSPEHKKKKSNKTLGLDLGENSLGFALVEDGELTDSGNVKMDNPYNGISHCFKYMRLESYEDALSNVELPDDGSVERMTSLFGDDYLIKYMLDLNTTGSVLNLAAFNDPFDYKLKVTEKNETKEVKADLMETFNYLIGLTVDKLYARKIFSASPDPAGEYDGAVKLTVNDNGEYIFRQIEGKLPSGERVLVIWRNITDNLLESNAALDAYFQRYRINPADREYDVIYVNGDNNIANLKNAEESWKVRMIEPEFKSRMFEEE